MTETSDLELLRRMLLIREFERTLQSRRDHGFQLLSRGQEAVAVGVCSVMSVHDQMLCSGRSIGVALACGLAPDAVMAELLGRATGVCRGHAGRGHLAQPSSGFFGAHAVVGGNLTIAAGVALALRQTGSGGIAICQFGDGACGAGALHETMNIAAIWRLPLLLVCDNNGYSVSTPTGAALAPARLSDLAVPFGLRAMTVDGMDVRAVRDAAESMAQHVRDGHGPAFLECISRRFAPHSTTAREIRSDAERAADQQLDPILALQATLLVNGQLTEGGLAALRDEIDLGVSQACARAERAPFPDPAEVFANFG